ncbi:hypothetical protein ACFYUH_21105 [Streptomyces fimicarius]|uniref:hypothetical protein n=1 Tax=Streptomyces griseus TaxID=1911 RepID=UPI00367CA28F
MFGVVEGSGGAYIILEDCESASPAYIKQGSGGGVAGSRAGVGEDVHGFAWMAEPSGGVGEIGEDSGSQIAVVGAVG